MQIVNVNRLSTCKFINGRSGEFRVITKCQAGFLIVSDCRQHENEFYSTRPAQVLNDYKRGSLQTVQFKAEGTATWLTVFARVGKKIKLVDEDILGTLDIGTINQLWSNTELYSQTQYAAVNAKTWADLAFVTNPQSNPVIIASNN